MFIVPYSSIITDSQKMLRIRCIWYTANWILLKPSIKSYYMLAPRATDRPRMISKWSKIWRWHHHTSVLASSSGVLPTHAIQLVLSVSAGLYLKNAPAVMAPSKLWSFHSSSRKLWIERESTMFKRNLVCSGHGTYYACVWFPGYYIHQYLHYTTYS